MLRLLTHPFSPYGRKVTLAAAIKGVENTIEVVNVDANPMENPALSSVNPLGKIPALIADGTPIYDSKVICEYLDGLAPSPRLIPSSGPERIHTLTLGALADGILDAALLLVYEKRFRPEDKWHAPWQQRQQGKIDRALDLLERKPPDWGASPAYGHLAVACALGYLDFRHGGTWRTPRDGLVAWLDRFRAAVPAFDRSRPAA